MFCIYNTFHNDVVDNDNIFFLCIDTIESFWASNNDTILLPQDYAISSLQQVNTALVNSSKNVMNRRACCDTMSGFL